MKITFCYSVVTPESAAEGDTAEHGWIMPGMWKYPLEDSEGYHEDTLEDAKHGDFDLEDLEDAIRFAESLGICSDDGSGFYSVDPDIDYQTGGETTYSMHVEGVTDATYQRIARLITGK